MAKQEIMLVNPTPRRRRKGSGKRRSNPSPKSGARKNPSRRRRRNPTDSGGGGLLKGVNLRADLRWALWRMAGKLASSWAVQRFGDPPEAQPGGPSPTSGDRWNVKNLAIAWGAGLVASQIVARVAGREAAQSVYNGSVDLVVTKALWTEIVGRLPYGRSMFGNVEQANGNGNALAQAAAGAKEGEILDDGSGNRWVLSGGKWQSMQGIIEMGALVEEGRLGALVEEGRLGSVVTEFGHIMTADQSGSAADQWGRATWRGSADPYFAAYQ